MAVELKSIGAKKIFNHFLRVGSFCELGQKILIFPAFLFAFDPRDLTVQTHASLNTILEYGGPPFNSRFLMRAQHLHVGPHDLFSLGVSYPQIPDPSVAGSGCKRGARVLVRLGARRSACGRHRRSWARSPRRRVPCVVATRAPVAAEEVV